MGGSKPCKPLLDAQQRTALPQPCGPGWAAVPAAIEGALPILDEALDDESSFGGLDGHRYG